MTQYIYLDEKESIEKAEQGLLGACSKIVAAGQT